MLTKEKLIALQKKHGVDRRIAEKLWVSSEHIRRQRIKYGIPKIEKRPEKHILNIRKYQEKGVSGNLCKRFNLA